MRDLVCGISAYVRERDPDFLVVPQNGHELLTSSGEKSGAPAWRYVEAIDGVGREDLLYGYEEDNVRTPLHEQEEMMTFLDSAEREGLQVLVTDYCWSQAFVFASYEENDAHRYVSFAADRRELDDIPSHPAVPHNVNSDNVTQLAEVKNFLYLLDPASYGSKDEFLEALRETDYDLVITDLFFDETEELTAADIASLRRKSNGGTRLLMAYMSIGEAEDYRYYWKPAWTADRPSWLGEENPDWPGNFQVNYWETEWQQLFYGNDTSYVQRILDAGFDGVYLDKIDAYEGFERF